MFEQYELITGLNGKVNMHTVKDKRQIQMTECNINNLENDRKRLEA